MKRKLDFVTNSSSCAFIFIGWKLDQTLENVMKLNDVFKLGVDIKNDSNIEEILSELGEKEGIDILWGELGEEGLESDCIYFGFHNWSSSDDYEAQELDINLSDLKPETMDPEFSMDKIKVITGMRMC